MKYRQHKKKRTKILSKKPKSKKVVLKKEEPKYTQTKLYPIAGTPYCLECTVKSDMEIKNFNPAQFINYLKI